MANEYGYAGSILKVDLNQARLTDIPTQEYADRFIGGRGFAAKIYWDGSSPEHKVCDPQNRLIFVTTVPSPDFRVWPAPDGRCVVKHRVFFRSLFHMPILEGVITAGIN